MFYIIDRSYQSNQYKDSSPASKASFQNHLNTFR